MLHAHPEASISLLGFLDHCCYSIQAGKDTCKAKQSFLLAIKSLNQIHYIKTISVPTSDFANTRLSFCCLNMQAQLS